MAAKGNVDHQEQYNNAIQNTDQASDTPNSQPSYSKDQVGWYFVESFYTTLSRTPEKLHLYYSKKSQFVHGREADVSNVSVGRQAILERIKSLKFQDCKVRISNVDTQASYDNILIQVIGETSNKGGEPKKFVQSFVLAQQASGGYYVLNDILRYICDEELLEAEPSQRDQLEHDQAAGIQPTAEPEPPAETAPAAEEAVAPTTADVAEAKAESAVVVVAATPVDPPKEVAAATEPDAAVAQNDVATVPETVAAKNVETTTLGESHAAAPVASEAAPAAAESAAAVAGDSVTPSDAQPAVTEETPSSDPAPAESQAAETEATKATETSAPAPAPPAPVVAEPEMPKEPPKPMTWAKLAGAAAGPPRPAVPKAIVNNNSTTTSQARPAVPVAPAASVPHRAQPAALSQPSADSAPMAPAKDQGNEWQTADSKRQSRAPPHAAPASDKDSVVAYIKYVTERVKTEDLRATLASFGELVHLDINRMRGCAFVEFATPAGYQAAANANPHMVNGENVMVEPRRPKNNSYGTYRNNMTGRGRGGYDGGRSGSQGGSRGGYFGQGRSRGGGGRGRGGPPTMSS